MAWADGFAWFWLLLCAAALGSFANVLVYRLPMQIVREFDITYITGANAQGTPVFIGHIIDIIVGNG